MFAFSEALWAPRASFHLEKGILKMKEKDWKQIMKAVTENPVANSVLKKKGRAFATEEEMELAWDSE